MKFKTLNEVFYVKKGGAQGNYGKILRVPVDLTEYNTFTINYYDLQQKHIVQETVSAEAFVPENVDTIVLKQFGNQEDLRMEKTAIVNFLSNVATKQQYWRSLDESTIFYFDPVARNRILISVYDPNTKMEYMIFEKMDGDLEMYSPKTQQDAFDIVSNLFNSLSTFRDICIHCGNFVHRDIKPANVMYKGKTVKVGDFSFMVSLNSRINDIAGTPEYMLFDRNNMYYFSQRYDNMTLVIINELYAITKTIAVVVALAYNKDRTKEIKTWFNNLMTAYPFRIFKGTLQHAPKTQAQLDSVINQYLRS